MANGSHDLSDDVGRVADKVIKRGDTVALVEVGEDSGEALSYMELRGGLGQVQIEEARKDR